VKETTSRVNKILVSRWLPWGFASLGLLLLVDEVLQPVIPGVLPRLGQFLIWVVALAGLAAAYLSISRYLVLADQRDQMADRMAVEQRQMAEAYQRLDALFQVSQQFVDASDENEILAPVLKLVVDLTGAQGATFVPLDAHGQPQTALSQGDMPFPAMQAWVEYLASPGVRERCGSCQNREPLERPQNCPLLRGPFAESGGLVCLPVGRGEREYGVLSLFLEDTSRLSEQMRMLLRALMDETALGLESVFLRRRELSALRQMQVLRQKNDLNALLRVMLDKIYMTLEGDFVLLVSPATAGQPEKIDLALGEFPDKARPFMNGIMQGVMASREPVLLGDVAGDSAGGSLLQAGLRSLAAAPLLTPEQNVLGGILVGSHRARNFHQRQLDLLQTIAGQVALVVHNAGLMADLEYRAMIQERARLSREIHDGLAQTIGFLKLQVAQLRGYLARDEIERARQTTELCYSVLTETYKDARQAIDGLRIAPDECGLSSWLVQTVEEFQELSGLPVKLEMDQLDVELSPEVHAQLVRIVQEALSNVRKHSQASEVWVACRVDHENLFLEVRDDGQGFAPEDITGAWRHGLRGMRERADLVGADFQVVSRPQEGTLVRLCLPLNHLEESVA
jgi:two-component system, NarL family, nitrate/nitrite sensor histidine kinase NarX